MATTPRIIGLTIWYDEPPKFLAAMVASMAAHIDHLVAVDGAFYLYPEAKTWSPLEQHEALLYTAHAAGLGLSLHAPPEPWQGNEVEKRTFLFRLGEQVAGQDDWYWVMDADQVVDHCPLDLRRRLEQTALDVGETTFIERHPAASEEPGRTMAWPAGRFPVRNVFRAIPGLAVETNHYTYVTPDGRRLWGNANDGQAIEDALDLSDLTIEHRTHYRSKHRHEQQYAYYRLRDTIGVERSPCSRCDAQATAFAAIDWELVGTDGQWQLAAGWTEVCADCKPDIDAESDRQVRELTSGQRGLADMTMTRGKLPRDAQRGGGLALAEGPADRASQRFSPRSRKPAGGG